MVTRKLVPIDGHFSNKYAEIHISFPVMCDVGYQKMNKNVKKC
jgi:hypothetical protein